MKKNIIYIFLSLLFLVLFYVFSLSVKNEIFSQINFDFTVKLQDNIPSRMDEVFEDSSFLVSPILSIFWSILFTLLFLFDIKHKKIYLGALLIPVLFALLVGIEIYGKLKVESPAPPFFMIKNPTTIFPKYHVQEEYSYPSGHASRSFFFSGLLSYFFWKHKNRYFFLVTTTSLGIFTVIISFGKIYLGHHWITDIIGGWILSMSVLLLCFFALQKGINLNRIREV